MKNKFMMRQNAYFTVEAALVLPLVMAALMLTVFLFCFQYNRCLVEQDANMLAVCAGTAMAGNGEELAAAVRGRAAQISSDKYVAWEMTRQEASVKGRNVSVICAGRMTFPLPEWNFFVQEEVWCAQVLRETLRVSPADYIRLYRKIKGGKNSADRIREES